MQIQFSKGAVVVYIDFYFKVISCPLLALIKRTDDVWVKFSHALHGFRDYWAISSCMCTVGDSKSLVLCFSNPKQQLIYQPVLLLAHSLGVCFGHVVIVQFTMLSSDLSFCTLPIITEKWEVTNQVVGYIHSEKRFSHSSDITELSKIVLQHFRMSLLFVSFLYGFCSIHVVHFWQPLCRFTFFFVCLF